MPLTLSLCRTRKLRPSQGKWFPKVYVAEEQKELGRLEHLAHSLLLFHFFGVLPRICVPHPWWSRKEQRK